MIRRLQIKIVALILATAVILAGAASYFFYSAIAQSLRRDSEELLERVLSGAPEISPFEPDEEQVQLPFFVVTADSNGKVVDTAGGYFSLTNQQQLQDAVTESLRQSENHGVLSAALLRYCRRRDGDGWKIAYADLSFERRTLQELMKNLLLLCGAGIFVILLLAILAAKLSVRPISKAMEFQRRFLSDASHELKTPLTVILSNAEQMTQYPMEPGQKRRMQHIQSEAHQMQALVASLLELGRAKNGTLRHTDSTTELSKITEDCVLNFEAVAFEHGHTLIRVLDPDLIVSGDDCGVRRLVEILLDNAIKYASPHTPISLSLQRSRDSALLRVYNACDAIPQEELPQLFARFYRGDAARTSEGFGLGLPIAKELARQYHGKIDAEMDNGRIVFTVELPLYSVRRKWLHS